MSRVCPRVPNPVNEYAARTVAAGVAVLAALTLMTGSPWLIVVLALGFGAQLVAMALVAVLLVFALVESVLGFCAGCWLFGRLMALGVIPPDVCEACLAVGRPAAAR